MLRKIFIEKFNFGEKCKRRIYAPVKHVWCTFLAKKVNSWMRVPTNGVGKGAMVLPVFWNSAFAIEIFLEISFCVILFDIQDIVGLSISIISLGVL